MNRDAVYHQPSKFKLNAAPGSHAVTQGPYLLLLCKTSYSKRQAAFSCCFELKSDLITSIVDLLLERSKAFEGSGTHAADYAQNVSDVFPVLQKLTTGIDVNVKFHNAHAFEPTPEVAVFDLLGIPLVHGWLVDPQDGRAAAVFGTSQLTPFGLASVAGSLKEHQLAVFFRNNHFNTLFKYEGSVYLLVTDQGYECEADVVWERMDGVNGDTTFCTGAAHQLPVLPARETYYCVALLVRLLDVLANMLPHLCLPALSYIFAHCLRTGAPPAADSFAWSVIH
ncbi:hypothetical protein COO60DRAFT_1457089 [Scenedesmus sp. NREL 46B-D3]|nr:hypothetical protein COO60DRAFT_1457089 [Scenedesmus sp. NREL 46B-D3]